jgi:hypothetical protein
LKENKSFENLAKPTFYYTFQIISQFQFIKSFNFKVNTTKFCLSEIKVTASPKVAASPKVKRILEVLFPEKTLPRVKRSRSPALTLAQFNLFLFFRG